MHEAIVGERLPMNRKSRRAGTQETAAYQLKITLSDLAPAIWRRVLVRGDINLGLLHAVIQVAMGWTNSHLHHFFGGGRHYSDPSFGLDEHSEDERTLDENRAVLMQRDGVRA